MKLRNILFMPIALMAITGCGKTSVSLLDTDLKMVKAEVRENLIEYGTEKYGSDVPEGKIFSKIALDEKKYTKVSSIDDLRVYNVRFLFKLTFTTPTGKDKETKKTDQEERQFSFVVTTDGYESLTWIN